MNNRLFIKNMAVIVMFLFIGIAFAPSINFNVVKASSDNDLVEVTTEACGIKGYGNTTVKLTRQQYQNLEQYLVDFRERLNQTTTKEEAVPLFNEAVVELDKYGLLPKGMNVERAQRLVIEKNNISDKLPFFKRQHNRNDVINLTSPKNVFSLLAFYGINDFNENLIFNLNPTVLLSVLFLLLFGLSMLLAGVDPYNITPAEMFFFFLTLGALMYSQVKPFLFRSLIITGDTSYFSLGLKGLTRGEDLAALIIGFTGIEIKLINFHTGKCNTFCLGRAVLIYTS